MSPKIRQLLYFFGLFVFAVLGFLQFFKIIDDGTAHSIGDSVNFILSLFGVTVSGTALVNVTKQKNRGVFDSTPEVSPADQILNGYQALNEQAQQIQADRDKIINAVPQILQGVPVLGPLAQQAINSLPN